MQIGEYTMKYFIVNKKNKALSEFHPNDAKRNPLYFKKNSAFSYGDIHEAEEHLRYIIEKTPVKYRKQAESLRVSTFAEGWV